MITQLLVAAVVAVAAVVIALALRRSRRPQAPTQPRHRVPTQLDRADFDGTPGTWLVVLFSSASCSTCADVRRKADALASAQVSVVEAEYGARRDLHQRYQIDAVPTLLLADSSGVVHASFLGPVTATDLWAACARMRAGGDSSGVCG